MVKRDRLQKTVFFRKETAITKVINLVDFDVKRLHDIVVDQLEILMRQPVLHISFSSCKEIINDDDFMSLDHQFVDQMGSHKASTSSN